MVFIYDTVNVNFMYLSMFPRVSIRRGIVLRRYLSTDSLYRAVVKQKFNNVDEIKDFITKSTENSWDPLMFSRQNQLAEQLMSLDKLKSLAELSGLNLPESKTEQQELLSSMNRQVEFLGHLHAAPSLNADAATQDYKVSADARILVQHARELTYEQLVGHGIEPDPKKGELPDSWRPTDLAKLLENLFFVFREKSDGNDQ